MRLGRTTSIASGSGWVLTRHAVERLIERQYSGLSFSEGREKLAVLSEAAVRRGERTSHWVVGGSSPVTLVTREEKGEVICVSVLLKGGAASAPVAPATEVGEVSPNLVVSWASDREQDLERRLRRNKEKRREERREAERVLRSNERLRSVLDIAARALREFRDNENAIAALAEIDGVIGDLEQSCRREVGTWTKKQT